jgi:hypothetical protein
LKQKNYSQHQALCNWGWTLKQSSAVHIQALVYAVVGVLYKETFKKKLSHQQPYLENYDRFVLLVRRFQSVNTGILNTNNGVNYSVVGHLKSDH